MSQLQSTYREDVGGVRLDLTKVDFAGRATTVDVETRVGVGSLTIVLPPNVDVVVDANVDVGKADVFGQTWNGVGLDPRTVTNNGADGVGGGTLHILARVDLGSLEVSR
jgi:predicted membrane protein